MADELMLVEDWPGSEWLYDESRGVARVHGADAGVAVRGSSRQPATLVAERRATCHALRSGTLGSADYGRNYTRWPDSHNEDTDFDGRPKPTCGNVRWRGAP